MASGWARSAAITGSTSAAHASGGTSHSHDHVRRSRWYASSTAAVGRRNGASRSTCTDRNPAAVAWGSRWSRASLRRRYRRSSGREQRVTDAPALVGDHGDDPAARAKRPRARRQHPPGIADDVEHPHGVHGGQRPVGERESDGVGLGQAAGVALGRPRQHGGRDVDPDHRDAPLRHRRRHQRRAHSDLTDHTIGWEPRHQELGHVSAPLGAAPGGVVAVGDGVERQRAHARPHRRRRAGAAAASRSCRSASTSGSRSGSSGPTTHDSSRSASAGFRTSTGPCRYVPTTVP